MKTERRKTHHTHNRSAHPLSRQPSYLLSHLSVSTHRDKSRGVLGEGTQGQGILAYDSSALFLMINQADGCPPSYSGC